MESQKTLILLNQANDSKFVTKNFLMINQAQIIMYVMKLSMS